MKSQHHKTLIRQIEHKLQSTLQPQILTLEDVSHKHRHHRLNDPDKVHLKLSISKNAFKNQSLIASHRQIYKILQLELTDQIHSIKIQLVD